MKIGFIGLGRMGANLVLHLLEAGHAVVVYDQNPAAVRQLAKAGATPASSLAQLTSLLPAPAIVWIMVPAGKPVDAVLEGLLPHLHAGDTVIDGGNSHYLDSVSRSNKLSPQGIYFLDVGTSGGLEGARYGASLTIGGNASSAKKLAPLWKAVSAPGGFAYVGKSGAGHYVKMVHNAVEYSLLQAYGEGFELLTQAPYSLSLPEIARVWNHGSVIRSWLLELAQRRLEREPTLASLSGKVGGGETGQWAVEEARKRRVSLPTVEVALRERKSSSKKERFSGKVISAIRNEFGGHAVDVSKKTKR